MLLFTPGVDMNYFEKSFFINIAQYETIFFNLVIHADKQKNLVGCEFFFPDTVN